MFWLKNWLLFVRGWNDAVNICLECQQLSDKDLRNQISKNNIFSMLLVFSCKSSSRNANVSLQVSKSHIKNVYRTLVVENWRIKKWFNKTKSTWNQQVVNCSYMMIVSFNDLLWSRSCSQLWKMSISTNESKGKLILTNQRSGKSNFFPDHTWQAWIITNCMVIRVIHQLPRGDPSILWSLLYQTQSNQITLNVACLYT